MAYTPAPFNPSTPYQNQVATELNLANQNFTILSQAFLNNDPASSSILRASHIGSTAPSNPVAGTTWLDTSTNPPTLKVYDGSNWQSNVINATNATNANNSNTVNNFPASLTPASNTIIPLNDNGILDLSSTYVKSDVYTFRRVDLTNASSDYMLQVGEDAIINFTNATNVPLHIATQSGTEYEVELICSNPGGTSGGVSSPICLNPNNTTYSNAFVTSDIYNNSSGLTSQYISYSTFRVGWDRSKSIFSITNYTQYKNIIGFYDIWGNSYDYPTITVFSTDWRDTTTPWTSLGTITFPQSSSGYILVRRVV